LRRSDVRRVFDSGSTDRAAHGTTVGSSSDDGAAYRYSDTGPMHPRPQLSSSVAFADTEAEADPDTDASAFSCADAHAHTGVHRCRAHGRADPDRRDHAITHAVTCGGVSEQRTRRCGSVRFRRDDRFRRVDLASLLGLVRSSSIHHDASEPLLHHLLTNANS
jgi:hypothetical protein